MAGSLRWSGSSFSAEAGRASRPVARRLGLATALPSRSRGHRDRSGPLAAALRVAVDPTIQRAPRLLALVARVSPAKPPDDHDGDRNSRAARTCTCVPEPAGSRCLPRSNRRGADSRRTWSPKVMQRSLQFRFCAPTGHDQTLTTGVGATPFARSERGVSSAGDAYCLRNARRSRVGHTLGSCDGRGSARRARSRRFRAGPFGATAEPRRGQPPTVASSSCSR
jgi:hypothetical protein